VQSVECGKAQTDISSLTTSTIYLIQRYNTNINFPAIFHLDLSEMSHLHKALDSKSWEEALNLINQGADVHAADESGLTPLHYAVLAYPRLRSGFHIDDHEYSMGIDIDDDCGPPISPHDITREGSLDAASLRIGEAFDGKAVSRGSYTNLDDGVRADLKKTLSSEKGTYIRVLDNNS